MCERKKPGHQLHEHIRHGWQGTKAKLRSQTWKTRTQVLRLTDPRGTLLNPIQSNPIRSHTAVDTVERGVLRHHTKGATHHFRQIGFCWTHFFEVNPPTPKHNRCQHPAVFRTILDGRFIPNDVCPSLTRRHSFRLGRQRKRKIKLACTAGKQTDFGAGKENPKCAILDDRPSFHYQNLRPLPRLPKKFVRLHNGMSSTTLALRLVYNKKAVGTQAKTGA